MILPEWLKFIIDAILLEQIFRSKKFICLVRKKKKKNFQEENEY